MLVERWFVSEKGGRHETISNEGRGANELFIDIFYRTKASGGLRGTARLDVVEDAEKEMPAW